MSGQPRPPRSAGGAANPATPAGASHAEAGPSRRARWPRLPLAVLGMVFVGGCAGGAARYAVTSGWPVPADRFPWPIFAVNTAGAFLLPIVVVIAVQLRPGRWLRPLIGTGFCGAFTTFSTVVVGVVQLASHHHDGLAAAYLGASILAALGAGSLGLLTGRSVLASTALSVGPAGHRAERAGRNVERSP